MKKISEKSLSRRKFMERSLQGAVGLTLLPLTSLSIQGCSNEATRTVFGSCYHDCPDCCSWTVTVQENKILDFKASESNPYTAGKLCDKMLRFPDDVTFHPDRILTPLKRTGQKGSGTFVPVSWDEALTEVSTRLSQILKEKGGEAVLPYSFAGNEGIVQRSILGDRFFAHIGASQLERTICGNTAVTGIMATNGQTTGVLPEDIIHSKYILLWGTNTVHSNQHLWMLIEKARKNGARIVCIDPYQSQTARQADLHIQPRPGTDTALALGMIHVILSENLQDADYIERFTSGIGELSEHVRSYDPETVSRITGLEPEAIRSLAREYAQSSPSLIRILIGLEHHANGGAACRAVSMLPALTGAWKQLGGGLMNMTYELFGEALNWEPTNLPSPLADPQTRTFNMIQLGRALNDPQLDPPIHALFVYNSNPAVTTPDQNAIIRGLQREDLLAVVIEHFMTDTARYADFIFPATSALENWDLLISWGATHFNINQPAIDPVGEAKPNSAFFRLLAEKMGYQEEYLYESDLSIIKRMLDSDHPYLKGITFDSLSKTGWARLNLPEKWMPHAEGNFKTPSGKCMLFNPDIDPPLPDYNPVIISEKERQQFPLHLLTVKSARLFLNSSHANVADFQKEEGQPVLDISDTDATARQIADGEEVKVYNTRGEVRLTARISSRVRSGVVCMPQGYWSSLVKGGSSANALTNDRLTDMGGGAAIQEVRVEVVKV